MIAGNEMLEGCAIMLLIAGSSGSGCSGIEPDPKNVDVVVHGGEKEAGLTAMAASSKSPLKNRRRTV